MPRPFLQNVIASVRKTLGQLNLYEQLSLALSLISAFSLIFIILQIRQTSQSLRASAFATIANFTMEIDKIFIDNAELRPYFYNGKKITEDDKDYNRVAAIAELELDFFDAVFTQLEFKPHESASEMRQEETVWRELMLTSFANSPALCERIKSNPSWYRDNLNKIAAQACPK